MLASSGLFSEIQCPFTTACTRPYCPFKHQQSSQSSPTAPSTSLETHSKPLEAKSTLTVSSPPPSSDQAHVYSQAGFDGYTGYIPESFSVNKPAGSTSQQHSIVQLDSPVIATTTSASISQFYTTSIAHTTNPYMSIYAPEDPINLYSANSTQQTNGSSQGSSIAVTGVAR